MAKLITTAFAIVGVFAGFVSGLLFAFYVLNLHDGDEAKTMTVAFGAAIAFAALFGWGAGALQTRLSKKYWTVLGSVGLVLALAAAAYIFSSIK